MLSPRSIVVVGASRDPGKRGFQAIRALQEAQYAGAIHGVNPRGGEACGIEFVESTADLPYGVDAALIALPARLVPSAIRELGERGVAGAVVLANGFGEVDTPEGDQAHEKLEQAVRDSGLRVIGPNTSGILNVHLGANLVGLSDVPAGPVSVVTQSGNMLLSLVEDGHHHHGPGFAAYVGLGNQADVRYDECVEYLAQDPSTGSIALHSEGLVEGRAFLQAATAASEKKPIILLRGGRSEVGQQAALSHTGSIAGSDEVATAALAQAGVELVERSDELSVLAGVMATTAAMPAGTSVAILADGGGHATLAADSLTARGVPIATLERHTEDGLRGLLGAAASTRNPVDVAGATDTAPEVFAEAAELLLQDPGVGLVLVIGLYGAYHLRFDPLLEPAEDATARRMIELQALYGKPLVVQSCYGGREIENHSILRRAGISVLASIDHATRAVEGLSRRGRWLATRRLRSDFRMPEHVKEHATDDPSGLLEEPRARALAEESGIDLGPWKYTRSCEDLVAAVTAFDRPCAVKVVSPQVVHKSDAGGVALNVTADDAAAVWKRMHAEVLAAVPGAVIDGLVVVPMADPGVELLVGATRDPIFGPVVAFGSGGVLVDALKDVSFRAAPLTELEAHELIDETVATRLLDGYRGLPSVDRQELARFLVRTGDLIATDTRISELDFNPVIAREDALQPVDVRIVYGADPGADLHNTGS